MISRVSLNKCFSTLSKLKCNNNTLYSTRLFTTEPEKVNLKLTTIENGKSSTEVADLVERISKLSILDVMDLTQHLQNDFNSIGQIVHFNLAFSKHITQK
ncbi:hypothetical protein ACTFIT_003608 [Dictyostelium discoideum]